MESSLSLADSHSASISVGDTEEMRLPRCRAGFVLFLLVNAVLFIRPADILPELEGFQFYNVFIILCLIASRPVVWRQLGLQTLKTRPATICILALLAAIVLSSLVRRDLWTARIGGLDFLKIVAYYFLLSGLVDSMLRLNVFLEVIYGLIIAVAAIALLQYHGWIGFDGLAVCIQKVANTDGDETQVLLRLCGPGIFNDPNDLALLLLTGLLLGVHFWTSAKHVLIRAMWLVPIALLAYAFHLTHSRGGFLALMAGISTLAVCRFGFRRMMPVAIVAIPVMFMVFGGRQTNFNLVDSQDTAQSRIQLWQDSLALFHHAPILGIGYHQLIDVNDRVAHNSYIHAFAELGVLGAAAFIGMLYLSISGLWRLKTDSNNVGNSKFSNWQPTILAMIVAYAIGLCSLTRIYTLPIYLLLGVSYAYCNLASFPSAIPSISRGVVCRIGIVTFWVLGVLEIFVRVMATQVPQ